MPVLVVLSGDRRQYLRNFKSAPLYLLPVIAALAIFHGNLLQFVLVAAVAVSATVLLGKWLVQRDWNQRRRRPGPWTVTGGREGVPGEIALTEAGVSYSPHTKKRDDLVLDAPWASLERVTVQRTLGRIGASQLTLEMVPKPVVLTVTASADRVIARLRELGLSAA